MTGEELQREACLDDERFAALVAEGIKYRRRFRQRLNRFFRRILPVCFHGDLTPWRMDCTGLKYGRFVTNSPLGGFWTVTYLTFNGHGIALQTPHQRWIDPLESMI